MNLKRLRIGAALVLCGFLFIFFVPIVYDATMFQCRAGGLLCLTNPSGIKSIGYTFFHWGGAYSPGGAGDPQLAGYTFLPEGYFVLLGTNLTAFGVLLFVAFPIAIACVGLVAPEMVKKSRATRIGFILYGAFVFTLSLLMFLTMASEGFNAALTTLGVVLLPMGMVMLVYGLRPGIFHASA